VHGLRAVTHLPVVKAQLQTLLIAAQLLNPIATERGTPQFVGLIRVLAVHWLSLDQ